jgi:hypothetical protein
MKLFFMGEGPRLSFQVTKSRDTLKSLDLESRLKLGDCEPFTIRAVQVDQEFWRQSHAPSVPL